MADSSAVCTWLLEEAGIAMVPGVAFGDDRYVRMSYATSDELLGGSHLPAGEGGEVARGPEAAGGSGERSAPSRGLKRP